jgi:RsmE family RNA methyltransferase
VNLLLLETCELEDDQATLQATLDHRGRHLREVLRVKVGDEVRVGILDGPKGLGIVTAVSADRVTLALRFETDTEPSSQDTLLLAVPRPRVLARSLADAAALGFGRVLLFRSWRVDKSHLRSKVLQEAELRKHLIAGLEQACRTRLPDVSLFPLFKPFVEDRLEDLLPAGPRFVAHPVAEQPVHAARIPAGQPLTLALGPEGGLIPYEVDAFKARDFMAVSAGQNPLRVETALAVLSGQLQMMRKLATRQGCPPTPVGGSGDSSE